MAWISALRRIGPATQAVTLAVFCAVAISASASAQTASTPAPTPNTSAQPAAKSSGTAGNPAHSAKHSLHGHADKTNAQPAVTVIPHPPDPPPPNWPVNDKAELASVAWNGSALSIAATNSSLRQILLDVSTATGVKVEGLGSDQRIYGSYGPATARDVLNQLLDGSGYNILMIGDKGEGTPRELVLTAKVSHAAPQGKAGNAQPNQNSEEDTAEDPEPPESDPNLHRPPGTAPPQPGQTRTPLQMLQDREQQQQQQQQSQPQTQQQPQPQSQQGFPPPPQTGFPQPPK
jgi:hypothetical protein